MDFQLGIVSGKTAAAEHAERFECARRELNIHADQSTAELAKAADSAVKPFRSVNL